MSKYFFNCPICTSNDSKMIYKNAVDAFGTDFFDIKACNICNTCFTHPIPIDISPYYPDLYRGYSLFVRNILFFFYKRRVSRWTQPFNPLEYLSVLEIGSGSGEMLLAFSKMGWDATGLERNERMAKDAQSRGINVLSDDISSFINQKKFNLIVMFNVLEHLHNPGQFLRICNEIIDKNGRLILSMQNMDSWQSKIFRAKWFHLDPPRHITHFSPITLSNVLRENGFRISRIRYSSIEHDPYGWIESLNNTILNKQNALTRFLMGIDSLNINVILAIVFAFLLLIPSILISTISWIFQKGSIMEITAILSDEG